MCLFLSEDSAFCFFFFFFKWLSAHFRKCNDAQPTRGSGCQGMVCFSTASSGRRLHAFPPPPTPTVLSNYKSNMADRINDRELITLARPNKTPALQGGWFSYHCFVIFPHSMCCVAHIYNNTVTNHLYLGCRNLHDVFELSN